MILEEARLYITKEQIENFESDFKKAGEFISSARGYIKHTLNKCIEQDNKYILQVEWEKLEDHTIGFRQSAIYQKWKALLHHYYDSFPTVEHFKSV